MIRRLILFFAFTCGVYVQGQIYFEKGYFIDNLGRRTECLVENIGWKNNPLEIEYKLTDMGEVYTQTLSYISEFGVYEKAKYVRHSVDIDRSSNSLNSLSTNRNPDFKEEELLLEVLIDGPATLMAYEDGSLKRFFYSLDNKTVKQLIHKEYRVADFKINENNDFRNQLYTDLKCKTIDKANIERLNYSEGELVRLFVKFNECRNSNFVKYSGKQLDNFFNLSIRPGLSASALTIDNGANNTRDAQFNVKSSFRIGLEAEFVMPFNRNKWAFIIEPCYRYYEAEKQLERHYVEATYHSIEFPMGIRHYFFLNKKSSIFVNGSVVFDLPLNAIVDYDRVTDLEIKSSPNLAIGFGYKFKNKIGLELRWYSSRNVVRQWQNISSDYKAISAILGYSFL
ncbi:outer membrane beta-barrel protein [Pareuzebyella sediminis]|uniref:outer membrane beta-barrel protein n=1 Tax=Pareuzebyella sediminis TaxID=2607998 RepID=UPI0011F071C1|nr:outer membrane beta-barrel protein [Pareuzebyella sediminis]